MPVYKKFSDAEVSILKQSFLASSFYPTKKKIKELAKSMHTTCLKIENWFKYNRRKMYFDGEFDDYKIRKTFNQDELSYLHSLFKTNKNPDLKECQSISSKMADISGYQIKNWFANQRRKVKNSLLHRLQHDDFDEETEDSFYEVERRRSKRRHSINKRIIRKKSCYKRKPPQKPHKESKIATSEAQVTGNLKSASLVIPVKAEAENLGNNQKEAGFGFKLEKESVPQNFNSLLQSEIQNNLLLKTEWGQNPLMSKTLMNQGRFFPFMGCQHQNALPGFPCFECCSFLRNQNLAFQQLNQQSNYLKNCLWMNNMLPGQKIPFGMGMAQQNMQNFNCLLQNQRMPAFFNNSGGGCSQKDISNNIK